VTSVVIARPKIMRDDDLHLPQRRRFPASRAVVLLGAIGLPLLISGVIALNVQLCLTGAVISAIAVVLHVILILAGA
jgi:hypothetical protein